MVETRYRIAKQNDNIVISKVGSQHHVTINFQRTVRVPDNNGQTSALPPSLGRFPLYNVTDYKETLPVDVVQKGGLFLPIYQREAMWINFDSRGPFIVKIYAGGVNVVSGESYKEDHASKLRRLTLHDKKESVQDYLILPKQPWLDGVATRSGEVAQFVAVQKGTGYSIEAQLTGIEAASGLTFEVTPAKEPEPAYLNIGDMDVVVKTLTGKSIKVAVNSNETSYELKCKIQDREGISPDQQRLIFAGQQLDDFLKLAYYKIQTGDEVHIVLRLRGGGTPEEAEMALARGGRIKQVIQDDCYPADMWHSIHTMTFNVQLLNSQMFESVTGQAPPETPIDAQVYAQAGLPFFDMYEEATKVYGDFGLVKTVGELDGDKDPVIKPNLVRLDTFGRRVTQDSIALKQIVIDRDGLLDPYGPLAKFRTVHDLGEELRNLSVAQDEAS